MSFELIFTLVVLGFLVLALLQDRVAIEVVMLVAMLVLTAFKIITIEEALKGFSNPAMLTIAALFVIGGALQSTGAIEFLSRWLLGRPKEGTPVLRLIAPVAALSAFMNNTPLVAFFMPIFVHVARKMRISPSKLLIPLSYAAIMGGTCTLVGTSTNLVVDAAMRDGGLPGIGMFELTWIGLPVTLAGLLYLTTVGQRLLPNGTDLLEHAEANPKEYTLELIVQSHCSLVGKTIRTSGLRELPGLYVYAIDRLDRRLAPVSPDEQIQPLDILCFSGMLGTIIDAQKIKGLEPVEHQFLNGDNANASLNSLNGVPTPPAPQPAPRSGHLLCEVVISSQSPLVGQSVKDADFRARYGASIVAVHRSGERIKQKIGQIVLQAGDTLLVDASKDFARRWRNSTDFILVSGLDDTAPVVHRRAPVALGILLAVVLGMTFFTPNAAMIALVGAAACVISGCITARDAHRSIDLSILLLIASALGVSKAMDTSGAATWVAGSLLEVAQPFGKVAVLGVLVIITGLLTELLSNNACAALMGTFAFAAAKQMEIDPRPFMLAVAVTASCGFSTPIGYQTNLMVLGPGGYHFRDFLKVGIPLDIISWILITTIVSMLWL
jgi:di/tricarboxylate transporter